MGILWALQPVVSFMTLHWHLSQINVDVVWEERRSSECLGNRSQASASRNGHSAFPVRDAARKPAFLATFKCQRLKKKFKLFFFLKKQLGRVWTLVVCLPLPSQRLVSASWLTAAGSSPRLYVRYLRPRTPSEISPRGPLFSGHTGAAERSVHEGCSRAASTANFFSEKSAPCCAYFPFFSPFLFSASCSSRILTTAGAWVCTQSLFSAFLFYTRHTCVGWGFLRSAGDWDFLSG